MSRPSPEVRVTDPHLQEIATILSEISAELELLGEALCHDPEFVARHMRELQAIDLIAQKQRALAGLLTADCRISAVSGVGLEEVAGRFRLLAANPEAAAAHP